MPTSGIATLDGHMRVNTAAAQLILPCWLGRNQPLNRVEAGYHVGHDEEAPAGEFGLDVAANHFGEVTVFVETFERRQRRGCCSSPGPPRNWGIRIKDSS